MTCPHCNAPLIADARFCPACGKATSPTESGSSWPGAGGAPDLVGREIAGRYRIVKKLGEGGMGAVYRGEQISLKRAVAVKVLRPELGANQMILRRFNAEAEAVAKLSHPNTVNIYDFGQDTDGSLFIAMEFIEGRSLRDAIQKEGPFSPTRAISIAIQVAASLSDAHSHSIVHRDLKPDNVMLQDRGRQKDVVRVLDFGIAKLRDENRVTQQAMTQAGDMLGTPQYMAPEQIRGERVDGRTDVYALGCMIYEMVTGRMPYEAPTVMAMLSKHLTEQVVPPSQRRPDLGIPPAIDQLVLGAMAKDPASRPATMEQTGELLQALLAALPAEGNRSGGLPQSAVVGAVVSTPTPIAPSAFGPPMMPPPMSPAGAFLPPRTPPPPTGPPPTTPAPVAMTPPPVATPPPYASAGFGPPSGPAPTANIHTSPTAPAQRRAPIWIVVGALALAGAGVGVWFATRGSDSKAETDPANDPGSGSDKPQTPDELDTPDEADTPDDPWSGSNRPDDGDHAPAPPAEDPWADNGQAPGAAAKPRIEKKNVANANVDIDQMPVPAGVKLEVGPGFRSTINRQTQVHIDAKRGIMIALTPMPGMDDPDQIADTYAMAGGVKTSSTKVMSAGKLRPAITITANGQMTQMLVFYSEPGYSFGVMYQAPAKLFADPAFQREVMAFFARHVVLP